MLCGIACRITKATDTHLEYVTVIAFPLQRGLHERPSLFRLYLHILCGLYCVMVQADSCCPLIAEASFLSETSLYRI